MIDKWLQGPPKASTPSMPAPGSVTAQLYLVYDHRDVSAIAPWADALFEHFEVVHPSFEGDEAEIREYHDENLRTCDGVLIFHGAANQIWLRRKLAEVQKIAGYGRVKAPPALAVCLIPPDTPEKARFRTRLAPIIVQTSGFSLAPLQPFIDALRDRTRGSPDAG